MAYAALAEIAGAPLAGLHLDGGFGAGGSAVYEPLGRRFYVGMSMNF